MAVTVDDMIEAFLAKKHTVGAALETQAETSFDQTRFIVILLSILAGVSITRATRGSARRGRAVVRPHDR